MKIKKLPLVLLIIVLVLGTGISVLYYLRDGSPQYSLKELNVAIANHDTVATSKYLDAQSIWSNFFPRYEELEQSSGMINSFAVGIINTQNNTLSSEFQASMYNSVRGTETSSTTLASTVLNIINSDKGQVVINGDSASITGLTSSLTMNAVVVGPVSSTTPTYPITIILQRQPDRTWKIVDIQGIEDLYFALNKIYDYYGITSPSLF